MGLCGGPSLEGIQVGSVVVAAGSVVVRACSSISVGLSGQGGDGLGCIPVVPMHPHLRGPRAGGAACSCDKTSQSLLGLERWQVRGRIFFFNQIPHLALS